MWVWAKEIGLQTRWSAVQTEKPVVGVMAVEI